MPCVARSIAGLAVVGRSRLGVGAVVVLLALVAAACSIDSTGLIADDLARRAATAESSPDAASSPPAPPAAGLDDATSPERDGLVVSGPTGATHWHAGYVVRICDDVLDPFAASSGDEGIHTHGDGVIHIHPFGPAGTYEDATLGVFAAASDLGLSTGELRVPGGGRWVDGDLCDGEPGELTVSRWDTPTAQSPSEVVVDDPQNVRLLNDGELFTISFAPAGSPPIKPPVADTLVEYSPALAEPPAAPFVVLPADLDGSSVRLWAVETIGPAPCDAPFIAESAPSDVRCFDPGASPIFGQSNVVRAEAVLLGDAPGVTLFVDQEVVDGLNRYFTPGVDTGGILIALEVNGVVVIAARASQAWFEPRITLAGGMSARDAIALAEAIDAG